MSWHGWARRFPKEPVALWDTLGGWDRDSQSALFAHVVSLSVNTCTKAWNRRPRAFAHADRLAQAVALDMAAAGWKPTVDTFLGRVTKVRILQAVTEAKGGTCSGAGGPPQEGRHGAGGRNPSCRQRLAPGGPADRPPTLS